MAARARSVSMLVAASAGTLAAGSQPLPASGLDTLRGRLLSCMPRGTLRPLQRGLVTRRTETLGAFHARRPQHGSSDYAHSRTHEHTHAAMSRASMQHAGTHRLAAGGTAAAGGTLELGSGHSFVDGVAQRLAGLHVSTPLRLLLLHVCQLEWWLPKL